jgi:hypothetical protein
MVKSCSKLLLENYFGGKMKGQRNNTLEVIKLVASYMVVLIHFYFQHTIYHQFCLQRYYKNCEYASLRILFFQIICF